MFRDSALGRRIQSSPDGLGDISQKAYAEHFGEFKLYIKGELGGISIGL